MNFEMAAELCQARGIQVEAVIINDDVAVQDSLYTAGRRGTGTTVLAEKICGAAAARGYDLGRVAALGRKVNERGRSMGMALTPCTVPAAGKPGFELGDGEIEMGVGIHGEPGRERMRFGQSRHWSRTWRRPSWPICRFAAATASLPWSAAWEGRPPSSFTLCTGNWS